MDSIWTRIEKLPSFPKLQGDTKTDVLIVGGGMAGICKYWGIYYKSSDIYQKEMPASGMYLKVE